MFGVKRKRDGVVKARQKAYFKRQLVRPVGVPRFVGAPQGRLATVPVGGREIRELVFTAGGEYNTTGTIQLINGGIALGNDIVTRNGNKIFLKNLQCKGRVLPNATTTLAFCRSLIVYDAQSPGTLPGITDILTTASDNAFKNTDNRDRFVVLKDEKFAVCGNATTAGQNTGATGYAVDWFFPINRMMTFGTAGTGVIGDIRYGAIYHVTVGSVAQGTADGDFQGNFKITFVDV